MCATSQYSKVFASDPDFHPEETTVHFRLTYEGELLPSTKSNPRASHKQSIRKKLHGQIKRLWELYPNLQAMTHPLPDGFVSVNAPKPTNMIEYLASNRPLGDYRFVPLMTEELNLWCGLDILFLRPTPPGGVLQSGDIDNRVKTLFDALKRPTQLQEVGEYRSPSPDEQPFFFCLLDNDSLVAKLTVETDTLLEPLGGGIPCDTDARLVIGVTLRPQTVTVGNLGFAG